MAFRAMGEAAQAQDTVQETTVSGTNKNAVHTQIWTAMTAILLLQYLRNRSRYNWHMSNLVTFLRIHLMSHIDLWTWLDQTGTGGGPPPEL